MVPFEKNRLNQFLEHGTVLSSILDSSEARIAEELRLFDHDSTEDFPIRRTGYRQIYVLTVAGKIRTVRADIVVPHADTAGFFASVPVMVWKIAQPRDNRVEHGYIDELSLAGFFSLI